MSIRSFPLNSEEFYRSVCPRDDRPWIPNGALPRKPRWPRKAAELWVSAASDEDADYALRSWLRHVEGREG